MLKHNIEKTPLDHKWYKKDRKKKRRKKKYRKCYKCSFCAQLHPHVSSIHIPHLYMNIVCRSCIYSTFDIFSFGLFFYT